ncbi:hypothetical protein JG687_00016357 [Phytophthora cactorum]|uniref:SET domain-containing protein n=1 Tax=Phytophthora cactorum TaxID=29920 RepID=A0A8T1TU05_9STRA|nr:hypothetical protein JG687_00016357 [Phytophthora cactorum]
MKQRYTLDLLQTPVGLGVVCSTTVPKDPFIIEYVGGVLLETDAVECVDRSFQVAMKTKATRQGPTGVFIDAARCGNESRFINHSCKPNCALFELEWTNTSRLGIFAQADIHSLRELTFRYYESKLSMFTCQCGHPNCIEHRM